MARMIDADDAKAIIEERYDTAFMQSRTRPNIAWWEGYSAGVNWARNTIDDAPTVDAVKVVRCKDCKHWMKDVPGCTDAIGRCRFGNYMVGAAGYCVYGERGEDEKTD